MTVLSVALPLSPPVVGTEFSYVLSDDGDALAAQGTAALALLPAAASVVLVVPARALSWHRVKLPPVAAGRRRAALEGVLEDRLLDDPAQVALALAPARLDDGSTLVAACDKSWLVAALQLFEQAGRSAARVVPELWPSADPDAAAAWVAFGSEDEPWLALVDAHAVVCVPLAQARSVLPTDAQAPGAAEVLSEPGVAILAERLLGRAVTIRPAAQALLAASRSRWELAQFDLAISGRGRLARRWAQRWLELARAPRWRAVRWGVAALVLVHLVGLHAWSWHLEGAVTAKRAQQRQLLTQSFPKVKTVVDAPRQMERELALLRQSSGALTGRDLEAMLSAVGAALPEGRTPTGLEFSAGQLSARGLALSPAQVDLLAGKLSGQGYTARFENERLVVRAEGSR